MAALIKDGVIFKVEDGLVPLFVRNGYRELTEADAFVPEVKEEAPKKKKTAKKK